jgi:hypothetical protein
MDFFRSVFYRVIPYQTIITKPVIIVEEETQKNINLKNYKIDFENFDKNIEAICINNMFYKYK